MRISIRNKEKLVTTILNNARLALCTGLLFGFAGLAAQAQTLDTLDHSFSSGPKFQERTGEQIYQGICQGCHMPEAQGAAGAAAYPALAHDPRLASKDYPAYILVNGKTDMPSFAAMLDDDQIAAVANYVRSHFGNEYADQLTAAEVKAMRPKNSAASE
jgi:mono/diheme cytochrome c family protein